MSAPFTISPSARDLTFNFTDSCNCCCWGFRKEVTDKTRVYVNSSGEVKRFEQRDPEQETSAMRRTVSNLNRVIGDMAEARKHHRAHIIQEVEKQVVSLDASNPSPITVDMIKRILAIVKDTPSPSLPVADSNTPLLSSDSKIKS